MLERFHAPALISNHPIWLCHADRITPVSKDLNRYAAEESERMLLDEVDAPSVAGSVEFCDSASASTSFSTC